MEWSHSHGTHAVCSCFQLTAEGSSRRNLSGPLPWDVSSSILQTLRASAEDFPLRYLLHPQHFSRSVLDELKRLCKALSMPCLAEKGRCWHSLCSGDFPSCLLGSKSRYKSESLLSTVIAKRHPVLFREIYNVTVGESLCRHHMQRILGHEDHPGLPGYALNVAMCP